MADGHEPLDAVDIQLQPPLVAVGDPALDDLAFVEFLPGRGRDRPLAGEQQQPVVAVVTLDGDLDVVTHRRQRLAFELAGGQNALTLAAHIDEDIVPVDGNHSAPAHALGGRLALGQISLDQAVHAHAAQGFIQLPLKGVVQVVVGT